MLATEWPVVTSPPARRPDVFTALGRVESGIAPDPSAGALARRFRAAVRWRSNRRPDMNPMLIPQVIPVWSAPSARVDQLGYRMRACG
ncbi:hypothetical protein GCM10017786_08910 [Amycolatopsis deserti]|uniref:Uncharacterized protein n=1 Tax=Amycolatopsis deserti TaxID=185696 RepID=A0ABQ3IG11_9PSEU|nr:hypothetical protein GCM10017786_08910 [Amycolatopsis deserti]